MKWRRVKNLEDENSIQYVEEKLGINFPMEFKEIVKNYNAGIPNPSTYNTVRVEGKDFGELLNFNLDQSFNILHEYDLIKKRLPSLVFPFAGDPGGNYLCYDFRENSSNPVIRFWDHEMRFTIEGDELVVSENEYNPDNYHLDFVANNINQLLNSLYGEEKEDIIKYDNETLDFFEAAYNDEELKDFGSEVVDQINARRKTRGLPIIKLNKKNNKDRIKPYKTHEGKNYTQEEWEAYEKKLWEDYKKKGK